MDCLKNAGSGAETLLDYCSGALEPARAVELERHIENCPQCFRAVEAQREVWEALGRWKAPVVSADFNARLYARIALENEAPAWRRWLRRLAQPAVPYALWKPAAFAAACAVIAVGFLAQMPADRHAPAPQTRMETDHVDIEQVANALEELDLLMPATPSTPASANPM